MPVTILDMIVIGAVLISALLAALRGFTREVLAIGSWAAAAAVAYLFHPMVTPLVQQYVTTNKSLILPVAAGGIFLMTLLVAYIFTSKISDMILDSRIGALDRSLGFLFGAARGLLLAVVGFAFFSWLTPDKDKQPSWVKDAKLKPLLESSEATLRSILPDDPDKAILQRVRPRPADGDVPRETTPEPQKRSEAPAPRTTATVPAVSPTDRAALNRIVEGGQKPIQQR